jgi:beta-amylase
MMARWKEEAKSQNLQLPQGVGPQTAGEYISKPEQTLFFQDQPEQPETSLIYGPRYWDDYGKSFLTWYSGNLIVHGKGVLQIAKNVFQSRNVKIAAKVRCHREIGSTVAG